MRKCRDNIGPMENTKEDYRDPSRVDDLFRFLFEHDPTEGIPDQRYEKGAPPQPGVPCLKCTYANHPGADQSFGTTYTEINYSFLASKSTCEKLIQQSKKQPLKIIPPLLNWLIYQNQWEEDHVAHVKSIETPGIITFQALKGIPPNDPIVLCHLADGTHRGLAALRAGRDFYAYVLTPKETLQCIFHMNGRRNPRFIGERGGRILIDGKEAVILP